MSNKELYKKAVENWYKLEDIVKNFKGSLEELCNKLYGHNFEDDLFDVNYSCFCATIGIKNNQLFLYDNIELWNDKEYELVGYFEIEQLKKEIS